MIQGILVGIAVLFATLYLGLQVYNRFIKKDSKCDSCAFGSSVDKNNSVVDAHSVGNP
jgi:hypothetical protein